MEEQKRELGAILLTHLRKANVKPFAMIPLEEVDPLDLTFFFDLVGQPHDDLARMHNALNPSEPSELKCDMLVWLLSHYPGLPLPYSVYCEAVVLNENAFSSPCLLQLIWSACCCTR